MEISLQANLLGILRFLSPLDLHNFYLTSKALLSREEFEVAWKVLCEKRWKENLNLLRGLSKRSYHLAYLSAMCKGRIPTGNLTERHRVVFGRGLGPGWSSWLLVGHSSDCRPTRLTAVPALPKAIPSSPSLTSPTGKSEESVYRMGKVASASRVVELRVCVQNTSSTEILCVHVRPGMIVVETESEDGELEELPALNPRMRSVNGVKTDTQTVFDTLHHRGVSGPHDAKLVQLKELEFAVFSFQVPVDESVNHETDLLCRLRFMKLFAQWVSVVSESVETEITSPVEVFCRMFDESEVFEHYIYSPGNSLLLKSGVEY